MLSIAFVLCAMQALALASPVRQEQRGIPIALSKRQTPVDDTPIESVIEALEGKYQIAFENFEANTGEKHPLDIPALNVTRRATGADPLTYSDLGPTNGPLWSGIISVGTPAKTYTVEFDTGSADLFLPAPECTSASCKGRKSYNPQASTSAVDLQRQFNFAPRGQESTVAGKQYTDTVAVVGLTATAQTLGAATKYPTTFKDFPPDGVLGMAYQSISAFNARPVFSSLVAQGQTTTPVFAFKLAKTGSELFLGGTNANLFTGTFTYTPVTTQGFWQVLLQSITVGNQTPVQNVQAIIDTGSPFIVGPTAGVRALYASIPNTKPEGRGQYSFPCSSVPNVALTFGGTAFPIAPSLFNVKPDSTGSNRCIGAIMASDRLSNWVVGDAFLQNVYTAFDMGVNRVGFATLR